jgi:hypothetical protein
MAMLDATELALAINNSDHLTKAIKEYEQNLFIRAYRAAYKSARSLDLCISSGNSAEKLATAFKDLKEKGPAKEQLKLRISNYQTIIFNQIFDYKMSFQTR